MNEAFEAVHGAGYRGVYDLADLDRSRFIVAPGQSGHFLSRHAGNLMGMWRDGQGVQLGPRPANAPADITLRPQDNR
jgi:penicillin amidase